MFHAVTASLDNATDPIKLSPKRQTCEAPSLTRIGPKIKRTGNWISLSDIHTTGDNADLSLEDEVRECFQTVQGKTQDSSALPYSAHHFVRSPERTFPKSLPSDKHQLVHLIHGPFCSNQRCLRHIFWFEPSSTRLRSGRPPLPFTTQTRLRCLCRKLNIRPSSAPCTRAKLLGTGQYRTLFSSGHGTWSPTTLDVNLLITHLTRSMNESSFQARSD